QRLSRRAPLSGVPAGGHGERRRPPRDARQRARAARPGGLRMGRINHVKIVSPEPEAVDRFLREVLEIPEGGRIPGARAAKGHAPATAEPVTWESVTSRRGDDGSGGFI